ncbi:multicopper oxidase domain-containing protein [soil metagenome]
MITFPRAQFLWLAAGTLFWRSSTSTSAQAVEVPPVEPPAGNPLRIPELLEGERGADGVVRFRLDVQAGTTQFRDGPATATWGVNGAFLGPTLRAARGSVVALSVHTGIAEPTTMYWHGMILPAAMDGTPHQPIEPDETWQPTWTIDQPAATLWYHPHPHGNTARHIYRGVCGMFVVEDDDARALDLPHTYGVDDLPVIIQDYLFNDDNQFVGDGKQVGDTLLVNGTDAPYVDVTRQRLRLRLLNASGKRVYNLGFADGRPFHLIGTDGGLLSAPVTLQQVPLSTGERAEIVVAFEPGDETVLRSFADGDEPDGFDVLRMRAVPAALPCPPLAPRLSDVVRLNPADAVAVRTFRLTGTEINGKDMSMDRIDETVVAGTVEIWDVISEAGEHNFHIHGVQFQVLEVDGDPPPAHLRGWKDTVALNDGGSVRLLVPFGPYPDPAVPYMYHCHKLRHEDLGMMGQFLVVAPDEAGASNPAEPRDP